MKHPLITQKNGSGWKLIHTTWQYPKKCLLTRFFRETKTALVWLSSSRHSLTLFQWTENLSVWGWRFLLIRSVYILNVSNVQIAPSWTVHLLLSSTTHLPSVKKIEWTVLQVCLGWTDRPRLLASKIDSTFSNRIQYGKTCKAIWNTFFPYAQRSVSFIQY